ncbi:hypothetical protein PHYSODRAFT_301481 [Phytophthora sojae]|uniref:Uncharacterized protein n=1 Tax=Phytophthora sojae (strain P6497) TaxID=1094619 RepID=G4ZQ37_PHYSP|nr:hypothetical protein PHYSODRAFT_301481 [Phytophthora sojae]EGZ14426.1 hypothetical protein PHYSODRAFT_301481 [Phytophthora sojae]|eukprot:XP_009528175.1 hypothetical protein PHYSODRAFT_301481 [Phytophthora sojae]
MAWRPRDPMGCRTLDMEDAIGNRHGKKLVLVLNKVDQVPPHVLKPWLKYLHGFRTRRSTLHAKHHEHVCGFLHLGADVGRPHAHYRGDGAARNLVRDRAGVYASHHPGPSLPLRRLVVRLGDGHHPAWPGLDRRDVGNSAEDAGFGSEDERIAYFETLGHTSICKEGFAALQVSLSHLTFTDIMDVNHTLDTPSVADSSATALLPLSAAHEADTSAGSARILQRQASRDNPSSATTQLAEDVPWAVNALSPVTFGEPLGRARGGWKSDVKFEVGEGYAVFKEKCIARFTALVASPNAPKTPLALPAEPSIYLRRTKNDPQAKYIELTHENFLPTLKYRWKLLTPDDLRRIGDFRFEAFLYVQRAAQPEQFHRATACRVQQARVQRMAFEVANAVQFGAITEHHLDVVNARRPESAPFEVPEDNTTAQAMELDRQREALQQQHDAEHETPATSVIQVRMNGLWMPLEVGILSLR